MDREHGARESCEFVRSIDFMPSTLAFDAAFDRRRGDRVDTDRQDG